MRNPMRVAAAQPSTTDLDVVANAVAHAHVVDSAQARVVVFPELSLTGYVLDAPIVDLDDPALAPLVEACTRAGTTALVGAPVLGASGRPSIATLAVTDTVEIVYRKVHLGGDELGPFEPGDGPGLIEVDGWRVGLGICKDTGVAEHVAAMAELDLDLYAAGIVHHAEEVPVQVARAETIARATGASVVLSSFAGPTGGGYRRTAGHSGIWSPDAELVALADAEVGRVVSATLT